MALDQLSQSPYYDDYDETKNFYRILFKPGLSVQTRELNQLQTILQKQIERHGSHVFKEGAKVFGGEFSYIEYLHSIKLKSIFGLVQVEDYISQVVGKVIYGQTSGVRAKVIGYDSQTQTDSLTLYVTYITSGTDAISTAFNNDEELACEDSFGSFSAYDAFATTESINAAAIGCGAIIEQGVYYVKNHFVLVEEQFHVISKYTNDVSKRVGLQVEETIVRPTDDQTLYDQASGTTNFTAEGADRYAIYMTLSSIDSDSAADADFIELERIESGRIVNKTRTTEYNLLSDNIARRTYDINGNIVIRPFKVKVRETLNDSFNDGVYESGTNTDTGLTASENLYTVQISEGKAYVYGYEIESTGSIFVDTEKPRDSNSIINANTTIEIGNYVRINNVHNLPDMNGSDVVDYPAVEIYDAATTTPGTVSSGNLIGFARVRAMYFDSGDTASPFDATTVYRAHLFDIKMMSKITLSGTAVASQIPAGTRIKGSSSGATAFVNSSSGNDLYVTSVSGTFLTTDNLISNNSFETDNLITNSGSTALTISAIEEYSFEQAKQLYYNDDILDFTADLVLQNTFTLTGTVTVSGTAVTGFNTLFTSEIRAGDAIILPSGGGNAEEIRYVASTPSTNTALTLTAAVSNNITSAVSAVRARALINDQDKNLSLRKLAKDYIKTISNESISIHRQFEVTSASDVIALSAPGFNFAGLTNLNYQISVVTAGTGSAAAGTPISVESVTGFTNTAGSATLTSDLFGDGAKIKVNATLDSTSSSKTKTNNQFAKLTVLNQSGATSGEIFWGTSAHHSEISLGVPDVYKVFAVYDSEDIGTAATVPSLTLSNISGAFEIGELIRGGTSGAIAYLVNTSNYEYVLQTTSEFITGETITGLTSTETATVDGITAGSKNILNNYLLDTGQRDNYYDISKLVLKNKASTPSGRLLVLFNYFSHTAGDYIDVDSYTVDYKEIPFYTSTRIDPEVRSPNGQYDLRSVIDYRPCIARIPFTGTANNFTVNGTSFDFLSRNYTGTNASPSATPQDNSAFEYDYEYYLGRNDTIWLTKEGEFKVIKGISSDNPSLPSAIPNAMRIADLYMPPYLLNIEDVYVVEKSSKQFRMEDIAKLEKRVESIEYYTSLSLLESAADTLQIKDANGFDRFKSGFLVDNFAGHKTGDTLHQDYRCAIDMAEQSLRPKYVSKGVNLIINEDDSTGIQRTGNIVTLPYTSIVSINQPYATRVEKLNPVLSFSWEGNITLSPSSDSWFETKRAPDVTRNVEGNYNAVLNANRNSLGTVWGASQISWSGISTSLSSDVRLSGSWSIDSNLVVTQNVISTSRVIETTSARRTETRQGVRTSVVPQIDTKLESDRVIARDIVPFMRSKKIEFVGTGFKPYTRVYPFFDKVDVSRYCESLGGSSVGTVQQVSVNNHVWSTISRINLDGFWTHDHGITGTQTLNVYYSFDQLNWVLVSSQDYNSSTDASATDLSGLSIPANTRGEVFLRLDFVNSGHSAFKEVILYDQGGSVINDNVIDLVRSSNWLNASAMFNSSTAVQSGSVTTTNYGITRNIILKVSNSSTRTSTPASGFIYTFNNATLVSNALVTDATGTVRGTFTIPNPNVSGNPRFQTGERTFKLTSSPTNEKDNVETTGEAIFSSNGILETKQRTFVATRNGRVVQTAVRDTRTNVVSTSRVLSSTSQVISSRQWRDPLAQSFQIVTPGGEFLTKIDVYFAAKDNFIPVTLQLREMENGYPTTRVLPLGEVTVAADDINTSADGSVATSFTFESPIYVKEGVELALVLLSDSEEYTVFISKMGESDIATNRNVSKQPYLGVLFKSQNASTWTPYDLEDLKFKVYRAQFATAEGTLVMNSEALEYDDLDENPIESFAGSDILKVTHYDHGMYSTSNKVEIKGVSTDVVSTTTVAINTTDTALTFTNVSGMPTSGTGIMFRLYNTDEYDVGLADTTEEYIEEIVIATVNSAGDLTITQRGVSPKSFDAGAFIELYEFNGIQFDQINTVHTIVDYGLDYYTIQITDTADAGIVFGGSNVTASQNALINAYQLLVPNNNHPGTSLAMNNVFRSGTSPSGNETPFATLNAVGSITSDIIELNSTAMVPSSVNETQNGLTGGLYTLNVVMNTTSDNISPVIDLERATLVCLANRLDNITSASDVYPSSIYVPPTAAEGDSGEAIYVTKRVQLKNPATAIKVFADIARLSSANVQVMYKILRSDDSTDFDEISWTYFNTDGGPDTFVNPSTSPTNFLEHEYSVESLPEFISFAIKIKLNGTNSSQVPKVKDLRAIALAT